MHEDMTCIILILSLFTITTCPERGKQANEWWQIVRNILCLKITVIEIYTHTNKQTQAFLCFLISEKCTFFSHVCHSLCLQCVWFELEKHIKTLRSGKSKYACNLSHKRATIVILCVYMSVLFPMLLLKALPHTQTQAHTKMAVHLLFEIFLYIFRFSHLFFYLFNKKNLNVWRNHRNVFISCCR